MTFQELDLLPAILQAVKEIGYTCPSPIQAASIPQVLAGRDLIGCAQTGTGKTAAFAIPILQRLESRIGRSHQPIRGLVLTPTRELALQIQESFTRYAKYLPVRSAVIFGGVGQNPQIEAIRRGVDVLVATPGRLIDLHNQGYVDLSRLEIFVLMKPTGCWTWASSGMFEKSLLGCRKTADAAVFRHDASGNCRAFPDAFA